MELKNICSQLQDSKETGKEQGQSKKEKSRREKRGCPKSERKELDKDLYKRLKKSSSRNGADELNADQHDTVNFKRKS